MRLHAGASTVAAAVARGVVAVSRGTAVSRRPDVSRSTAASRGAAVSRRPDVSRSIAASRGAAVSRRVAVSRGTAVSRGGAVSRGAAAAVRGLSEQQPSRPHWR